MITQNLTILNCFIDKNSLVEGESDMDEFVALRERRNSNPPSQTGDMESGCGGER
jgi:hypothetical protein